MKLVTTTVEFTCASCGKRIPKGQSAWIFHNGIGWAAEHLNCLEHEDKVTAQEADRWDSRNSKE